MLTQCAMQNIIIHTAGIM